MAKIERATHKIFGGTGSSDNFAEFGSLVAGAPVKTKDIASIQSLAAWDSGFQDALYGADKNWLLEDMNSFAYEHSSQIAYLFQMGVPEWDASTTYYKGSIVQRKSGSDATGELYMSVTDANTGNALPVQANNAQWQYMNAPALPVGTSLDFMGIDIPVGFLAEDGTAVSRVTYAALLAAITKTLAGNLTIGSAVVTGIADTTKLKAGFYISGTGVPSGAQILTVDGADQITMTLPASSTQTPSSLLFAPHGVGDGSTTFNTPDTRRRVTVGDGGSGTATLGSAVGAKGGEETHTLSTAEMPAHTHTAVQPQNQVNADGASGGFSNSFSATPTSSVGSSSAHNNIQPSIVVTRIIKY